MVDKFLSMVVSQYEFPKCIISGHDCQICGHFWDELMPLLEITLTFSMALHPHTNSIAKVINHAVEYLL